MATVDAERAAGPSHRRIDAQHSPVNPVTRLIAAAWAASVGTFGDADGDGTAAEAAGLSGEGPDEVTGAAPVRFRPPIATTSTKLDVDFRSVADS